MLRLHRSSRACPRFYLELIEGQKMNDTKKIKGKIIKISTKGWGFISSRDIEFTRIFFHWTALRQDTLPFKELKTGMNCEFQPVQIDGRGWRAIHVKVIEKEKIHGPIIEMPVLSE
jgi:cold shock CspA family protein